MITADNRCSRCDRDGKGIYRMVGQCTNCGMAPILVLHSESHTVSMAKCSSCGNDTVRSDRLATEDEIPEAQ